MDNTEKVSKRCEVLSCSDNHEKGTEATGIHIGLAKITALPSRKGRLNQTSYVTFALTTFPKRTKSKYICPRENLEFIPRPKVYLEWCQVLELASVCQKWFKAQQDSG